MRTQDRPKCPNCERSHGAIDACLLGVLAAVIEARHEIEITAEDLFELEINVDQDFWDRFGGPAADWLEERLREQTNVFEEVSA